MTETNIVYFCPECGSASVVLSALSGGVASCEACSWAGTNNQLAAMPFSHELGDDGQVLRALTGDLRALMARDVAVVFAKFLQKWGFIDASNPTVMAKALGRYLAAMARGIVSSILEERAKIEKERQDGS